MTLPHSFKGSDGHPLRNIVIGLPKCLSIFRAPAGGIGVKCSSSALEFFHRFLLLYSAGFSLQAPALGGLLSAGAMPAACAGASWVRRFRRAEHLGAKSTDWDKRKRRPKESAAYSKLFFYSKFLSFLCFIKRWVNYSPGSKNKSLQTYLPTVIVFF